MGIDVAELLAQYEQAPTNEPMHGQRGQVRRNPSADQKKVRRAMTVQKKAETDRAIAQLLRRASVAPTLAEQQDCMAQVEQLKTAQLAHYDAERSLDLTVKEAVEIIPRGTHELTSNQTDWLLDDSLRTTASTSTEAEHALVAEAALWFERVPDYVKEDRQEFLVQAHNLARRTASQYGDHAEAACAAFEREAVRLYRQGQKTGAIKTAALVQDLEGDGGTHDDPDFHPEPSPRPANQDEHVADPHEAPKPGPHLDASIDGVVPPEEMPFTQREIDKFHHGQDAQGVGERARGYAQQQVHGGLDKAASLQPGAEENDLAAVLAGFEPKTAGPLMLAGDLAEGAGAAGAADGAGAAADLPEMSGMPGGGSGGDGGAADGGSDADGVGADAHDYASQQITSSSQVPQVGSYGTGGSAGMPTDTFPTFGGYGPEPNTSSNRSPAIEELQNFTGWDGSSVVPPGDTGAAAANQDAEGTRDAAQSDPNAQGFPVSGSQHVASRGTGTHHSKESTMDQAACPTCSGTGHVAVRKQAYSGLPQIDQIVSADETPDQSPAPGQSEHYPEQVAFPLNGWGATPQQGGQNVQNAINQAEGQISDRNARSPLVTGTTAAQMPPAQYVPHGQQVQANGRDNSGWLGDMGAKGTDYPGYSTPDYDGSNNLGQPDPVYGYGGDNGNQPLRPYGEMEANDDTNNPPEPFQYGVPHNNDQSFRQVSPGMSTQGSQDPFIAQARAEMARLQDVIAVRQRQHARQAG